MIVSCDSRTRSSLFFRVTLVAVSAIVVVTLSGSVTRISDVIGGWPGVCRVLGGFARLSDVGKGVLLCTRRRSSPESHFPLLYGRGKV